MTAQSSTPDAVSLELRVLSGLHAGARVVLENETYTVGAHDECDIVLSDCGITDSDAQLARADAGWQLTLSVDQLQSTTTLVTGTACSVGPVVIAIDDAARPWPTLEELVLVPHGPALEQALPFPVVAQVTPPKRWSFSRVAIWTTVSVLALASVSAAAVIVWPHKSLRKAASDEAPSTQNSGADVNEELPGERYTALAKAIAELGLQDRVVVKGSPTGFAVHATVLTDTESEALTAALMHFRPPPALQMITESELREQVADVMLRLAPTHSGALKVSYVGRGQFRLEGRLASAGERDKLLRALNLAVPHARGWVNEIIVADEESEQLVRWLRSQGWQLTTSRSSTGQLALAVKLKESERARWESSLTEAARQHSVPFSAQVEIVSGVPSNGVSTGPDQTVPFAIKGVLGGEAPVVMMPDGALLGIGGTWNGWTLASLSSTQIIFQSNGKRATFQR